MPFAPTTVPIGVGASETPTTSPRGWFAVLTRTHHEKRVSDYLGAKGIESFLPLYQAVHQWTHYRKATLDLPLFPNYLFVHIAPQERIQTLAVAGVVSLVTQGNTPAELPEAEIECLRSGLPLRKFEPHPYLVAGARARIVSGPFAGMEGAVLRRKGCLRVVLTVEFIQQSVAVEVDADELEPCTSPAHR